MDDVTLELVTNGRRNTHCDVVFLHGLQIGPAGDRGLVNQARANWVHSENPINGSWPDWVAQDHPEAAVWILGYQANASEWIGPSMPIERRAKSLLERLWAEDLGERPIAFVMHSMGGLIVKEMLRIADGNRVRRYEAMARNVHLLIFLATPHLGSNIPDYISAFAGVVKKLSRISKTVGNLAASEEHLASLNEWFGPYLEKYKPDVTSYVEELTTAGIMVVPRGSVYLNYADHVVVPLMANHLDVCRPKHSEDLAAPAVRKHIARFVKATRPLDPSVRVGRSPVLNFVSATEIDSATVPVLLESSEAPKVLYHSSLQTKIEVVEARDTDFMPFMEQNPYFMAKSDMAKRESWASAVHASLSASLWKLRTLIVANEEALGRLLQRLRSERPPPEMSLSALRTFGRFAALRVVARLKDHYDVRDGVAVPWFLDWELNKVPNLSRIGLVPTYSTTGGRIFGSYRFVLARVGVTEAHYDYVVLPFDLATRLHQRNGRAEDRLSYYNWVLPQLAYESTYFDEFKPDNWEVYVLKGNDGEEWYFPGQRNPWP